MGTANQTQDSARPERPHSGWLDGIFARPLAAQIAGAWPRSRPGSPRCPAPHTEAPRIPKPHAEATPRGIWAQAAIQARLTRSFVCLPRRHGMLPLGPFARVVAQSSYATSSPLCCLRWAHHLQHQHHRRRFHHGFVISHLHPHASS